MKQYTLWNNLLGWLVFLISGVVYTMTLEPTASFWDCGEFISSLYKLEAGHPPGNPFFMLTGRFFANFATDSSQVAWMVNCMSGLLSAGTILFLFWSITHLARKLTISTNKENEISLPQLIIVMGSGLVGSLTYAFTDTFWFSAVEGEVYAYSSFCTAAVFWLILKWEQVADSPYADRYLILIAYIIGLSIGIHLLNLLCIPAVVLVYYYKKYPDADLKGSIKALFISFGLIVLLLYGIVPGFVSVSGWIELLLVNTLGLPFNWGVVLHFFLTLGVIAWGIYETYKEKSPIRIKMIFLAAIALSGMPFIGGSFGIGIGVLAVIALFLFYSKKITAALVNTSLLCLLVILIGYSSYALILIRASAYPPMNQDGIDNVFALRSYLGREQYGDNNPLLYGHSFVSPTDDSKMDETPVWRRATKQTPNEPDRYEIGYFKYSPVYDSDFNMLFPRMHSASHADMYKSWVNFEGQPVSTVIDGEQKTLIKPTFAENIRFFINYQVNFMYWRYFLWNFAGRQNDIQGHGNLLNGNWITGFNFIDNQRVGDQSTLPDSMKSNKGRNVYYMLPLLLGLAGLLYQVYRGNNGVKQFWVLFFLFFMTGLAIVIYLNQTPLQVRERDYAYAGSFYAFSIWIGLGVIAVSQLFQKRLSKKLSASLATLLCLAIPVQVLSENWDDHDRSGRTLARDFAQNMLDAVDENGILFSNPDNDTFPLWYLQEVEGYRTDVRICNLNYLHFDWYISQMKTPAYRGAALPISLEKQQYQKGSLETVYLTDRINRPITLDSAMQWLRSDAEETKTIGEYRVDHFPSKEFTLPADSAQLAASGIIPSTLCDSLTGEMLLSFKNKNGLRKRDIVLLDMLNTISKEGWKQPVYVANTTIPEAYTIGFGDFLCQRGLVSQLIPAAQKEGSIHLEKMYDNLMHKTAWGGADQPHVYFDETNRNILTSVFQHAFISLATELINVGDSARAIQVLDHYTAHVDRKNIPFDAQALQLGLCYLEAGETQKGKEIIESVGNSTVDELKWIFALPQQKFITLTHSVQERMYTLQLAFSMCHEYNQSELANNYISEFQNFENQFKSRLAPYTIK